MRARNIKPGFFTNDELGEMAPLGRLLFAGLWCLADRAGRLVDRPRKIRAEVLPFDDCDANALLSDLARHGLILRYAASGKQYIQILEFAKHQSPHVKESASTIPAPDSSGTNPSDCGLSDSLIPDSLIPDSGLLDSNPKVKSVAQGLTPSAPRKARDKPATKTGPTWESYATAYALRYGATPVSNRRVNGQLAQFVDRVGAQDAPHVAASYLRNSSAFYVARGHAVSHLLSDAEKLRTEWATNRSVTQAEARQMDRTQGLGNVFGRLIDKAKDGTNG